MAQAIYEYGDGAWTDFLAARDSGQRVEIGPEMFDYWLGVLPPVGYTAGGFWFAEGSETPTKFWGEGERYFCQRKS